MVMIHDSTNGTTIGLSLLGTRSIHCSMGHFSGPLCGIGLFILLLDFSLISACYAQDEFKTTISPFLKKYCHQCHRAGKSRGELDFDQFKTSTDITNEFRRWNNVIELVRQGEMPPEEEAQPEVAERASFIEAVENILLREARKSDGDPGLVPPRRLSNVEYDLSIKDLTGIDIRPTKEFPPDPAGGEGFTNTGEALRMSPNLLNKYLSAADEVANHLVLTTEGIRFASFPVTSYNERKKFAEQAIIDFYENRKVDLLVYVEACWRYRYREPVDKEVTIESWAKRKRLSGKYLRLVWQLLNSSETEGIFKNIKPAWDRLVAPTNNNEDADDQLGELVEVIEWGRQILAPPLQNLIKSSAGNWPIAWLDFRAETAAARDKFSPRFLRQSHLLNVGRVVYQKNNNDTQSLVIQFKNGFSDDPGVVQIDNPIFSLATILPNNEKDRKVHHKVQSLKSVLQKHDPKLFTSLNFGKDLDGKPIDEDSFVLRTPCEIELQISQTMAVELDRKNLLLPCVLDELKSPGGSVLIQCFRAKSDRRTPHGPQVHLIYPNGSAAKRISRSSELFCKTFPNRFYYSDRNRGLAAGFHLVEGFFRDDQPLVDKVLSDSETKDLNRLWRELDFITNSAETLLRGFVWFERSEREVLHDKSFDFLRPESPDLTTTETLLKFERLYMKKMGVAIKPDLTPSGLLQPEKPSERFTMIHRFFEQIRVGLDRQNRLRQSAEKKALVDLMVIAERAFQRKLLKKDRDSLLSLYEKSRASGQSIESSLRGVMIAILMSPDFIYRYRVTSAGKATALLSSHEFASRLSYFLWSTLPDTQLRSLADADQFSPKDLESSQLILKQSRRMLKNDHVEDFCREFFGHWFRYHNFLEKENINTKDFPQFDMKLRESMCEEPTRFAKDIIQNDLSILNFLNADHTFVNSTLAKHYGGKILESYRKQLSKKGEAESDPRQVWEKIEGIRSEDRGGILGMAVILTTSSSGSRTSPVKRGFWVARHLLGQHFPPPPEDVPELPKSEKESTKTIRELLKEHAAHQQCAMCHKHFDFLGLSMEGFDPIGRRRTKDLAGRVVDNSWDLREETNRGMSRLIEFVEKERKQQFVKLFCRKLLGYALGRSVTLSDRSLLEKMEKKLRENGYRFSAAVETIVLSPQFTTIRQRDFTLRKKDSTDTIDADSTHN